MPSEYNLPAALKRFEQQEPDRYNKLPFYLAMQSAKHFGMWPTWNKLFGTIKWQPNMGSTLKGVITENSPLGRQFIYPNPITQPAKKDVFSQHERTNEAIIYRHKFESPQFTFLPSFQDFRKNQLKPAQKDVDRQITFADDVFCRGFAFDLSPAMIIAGYQEDNMDLIACPYGLSDDTRSTGKTAAFLADAALKIAGKGNLSMRLLARVLSILREDVQAPAFEGMVNVPKPNETIKGKYCIIGSNEAWTALTFDDYVLANKDDKMNLLNDEFSGVLFGNLTYKTERFPLRMTAEGTFPPPEIYVEGADAHNRFETVPNPDYIKAPYEFAFAFGGGAFEKINVGPPPSEFAGGRISAEKFNRLRWNGETIITDDVLVQVGGNAETPELDTNKYGEVLQIIGSAVFGMIPNTRRYFIPILFKRWRVEVGA